jgi:peptidoglycan hydrolase-like protein with peptidoglycan-binding domain
MSPSGSSQGGGSDQSTVRQVQEQLKSAGFDPGPIDGQMGPQTQKALRDYQKSKGMKATGQLDQDTEQALLSGGASGATSGGSGSGATGSSTTGSSAPKTTEGGSSGSTPGASGSSPGSSGATGGSSSPGATSGSGSSSSGTSK